ncbi:hypothetical protein [Arthrobacter russicus]|jgi:hypothetical protein|uniref:Anti-sigma factor n=1 Tax=Arthrobacter russicus TaxID=172040 RepID=A0ABU1J8K0_9MICC|nr:hypothetical protein [Arthrobacter russicus]MDR6268743.1 hypothetical protein [Arthrobacter russicus]
MTARQPHPSSPATGGAEDLTARILQRTQAINTSCAEELRLPYRPGSWRKPALLGVCTLAITGLLGGAVYLVGAPADRGGLTAGWPAESAASFRVAANPGKAMAESRSVSVGTAPASSDADGTSLLLNGEALAELRESGWSCPDLGALGFRLAQAQGTVVDGVPTVKLTLDDGDRTVLVYERHPGGASADGPVNPLTGNVAADDGFQPLGDGKVWLNPGETWQAVLNSGDANYLVVSDQPPSALKPTTAALAASGKAASESAGGSGHDDVPARIMRGLSRILAME